MKYYIPNDNEERLKQLNEWFSNYFFSDKFFKDEDWLSIRLNISKWKSLGYPVSQKEKAFDFDFSAEESALLYNNFNSISEILLFDKELKSHAAKMQFDKALLFQNFYKNCLNNIKEQSELNKTVIPFFKFENEILFLKFIDNYFILEMIHEKIRF